MWLVLKDKVLVLLSITTVISLALSPFENYGTLRLESVAPVDWVEGVAIMVAVTIVPIVGSLNDWQKEEQFKSLDDKKEERGVGLKVRVSTISRFVQSFCLITALTTSVLFIY